MSASLDRIVECSRAADVDLANTPIPEPEPTPVYVALQELGPNYRDFASMLLDNVDPHLFHRGLVGAFRAREIYPCESARGDFRRYAELMVDQMLLSAEQYLRDMEVTS